MLQPWSMWIYHQAARSNSLYRGYHITPRSRERINEVGAPSKIKLCCTNLCFKRPLLNIYLGNELNWAFRQIVKQHIWWIKHGLLVCFFILVQLMFVLKFQILFGKYTEKQPNNCEFSISWGLQTQTFWSPQVVTVDVPKGSKLVIYFAAHGQIQRSKFQ